MLAELFSIVAPIFIVAGAGFIWGRLGKPYDAELVTTLVYYLGTPCLVFSILANVDLQPEAVMTMAGAALTVFAVTGAIAFVVLRIAGWPLRAFLPSMVFANSGNMGLPLCLLSFGDKGLALGITFFTLASVLNHTIGSSIAAGVTSVKQVLKVPMVYAAIFAGIFLLSGHKPPDWVNNTTKLIGGMTIPLLLITLGISLARLQVANIKRSVVLSMLRLGLGFGVGVAIAELFGLQGEAWGVLVLQSSLPVAVFNFLFAKRAGQSPEEVAGVVVVSTTMAFVVLPGLIWFVLRGAGF